MRLLPRLRRPRAPLTPPLDAAAALAEHAARLAAAIARVEEREARVREKERFVQRWLERGAAELDERHGVLRTLAEELTRRERRLADHETTRAELEAREEELAKREARLALEELALRRREEEAAPAPPPPDEDGHVVFAWSADGYRLAEREGPAPAAGERLDGRRVLRVGRSPLPGDRRRCAYLE